MYDIIGDIHGYAEPLERLLTRLGYGEQAGVWRHPKRQVIFLGDFIDRGPDQRRVLQIARAMCAAGSAQAVLGNHEFNAIAWAAPAAGGGHLRAHSERNRVQHQSFLEQLVEGSKDYWAAIDWFKTLPLYLDLPALRVIHACWQPSQLAILKPLLDSQQRILDSSWPALCDQQSPAYDAVENALKGMEIALPDGVHFFDKDGNERRRTRTRWWLRDPELTYQVVAMVPPTVTAHLPADKVPLELQAGYSNDKPLFIGHYWMTGEPELITPYIACLDWSVASKLPSAKLCAYRFDGEQTLQPEKLIWVDKQPD